jgi:hypothetical protein
MNRFALARNLVPHPGMQVTDSPRSTAMMYRGARQSGLSEQVRGRGCSRQGSPPPDSQGMSRMVYVAPWIRARNVCALCVNS